MSLASLFRRQLPPGLLRLTTAKDNAAMEASRRIQFSLRTLLIGVVAVAFVLAAMRSANSAWASAVVSITILWLVFSIVLAAYKQPFWIGFAICGISYFVLVESRFASEFVDRLFTTRSAASLRDLFHPQADYFPPGWMEANLKGSGGGNNFNQIAVWNGNNKWQEMAENFRLMGICLWALILAALGGLLAQFAARRRHDQTTPGPGRAPHSENGR
jgi:hypothetical protein